MLDKFTGSKYIFVVGIGGSDLASKAVWNAMTLHRKDNNKKIFFLESPDSREYEELENFVMTVVADLEEVALIAVSKSGRTTETLEAYHKTFDILSEKFGTPISERVLVISTPGTPLSELGKTKNIAELSWEGDIGGRFSAFTVAHSSVLQIAGLNTSAFLDGSKNSDKAEASKLAEKIFDSYKNGGNILDFFIFNSELEDLGKWCRQLIAESLSVITPTVSMGPVDLHSMLELYLGGPKNRFTVFVRSLKEIENSVNESAYENTLKAYEKSDLQFSKYEMDKIDEFNLGKFMMFMMEVTIELAKLLGVDPYDQPAVEKYKSDIQNSKI